MPLDEGGGGPGSGGSFVVPGTFTLLPYTILDAAPIDAIDGAGNLHDSVQVTFTYPPRFGVYSVIVPALYWQANAPEAVENLISAVEAIYAL